LSYAASRFTAWVLELSARALACGPARAGAPRYGRHPKRGLDLGVAVARDAERQRGALAGRERGERPEDRADLEAAIGCRARVA
jgi:hypothetical protein